MTAVTGLNGLNGLSGVTGATFSPRYLYSLRMTVPYMMAKPSRRTQRRRTQRNTLGWKYMIMTCGVEQQVSAQGIGVGKHRKVEHLTPA